MKVLFIDIDTLRPDHMSCYGYSRKTTPNIDEICSEGMRFNQYYCSDAPCLPSRASLISGMFGIRNGAVGHGGTNADRRITGAKRDFRDILDENNFNNIFRRAGYHTASISTFPERHSSMWFSAGFNETYNVGDCGVESGEKVLPIALDWIDRNSKRDDWYLHVHLWDPHTPYRAPQDFGEPFADVELDTWITEEELEKHKLLYGPHSALEINMYDDIISDIYPRQPGKVTNMVELKKIIDGYDTGILYADFLVGQIIDSLKKYGLYEDTAIIISSDHGENFGELGVYAEHGTADDPTCRIPMIIKWPGLNTGVNNNFHYSLDLLPTLSDLLKVDKCENWDGRSYAEALNSMEKNSRDYLVISQMAHVCQRSVRFDKWIYIRTYHNGYHWYKKEMLFDLENDPYEKKDVSCEYPEICNRACRLLMDWHDEQRAKNPNLEDPLWTVMAENGPFHTWGHYEEYIERLKATGRSAFVSELEDIFNSDGSLRSRNTIF